jgi:hypothetical protein
MIGDERTTPLAESLRESTKLTFLDVSLNEIGPSGF